MVERDQEQIEHEINKNEKMGHLGMHTHKSWPACISSHVCHRTWSRAHVQDQASHLTGPLSLPIPMPHDPSSFSHAEASIVAHHDTRIFTQCPEWDPITPLTS